MTEPRVTGQGVMRDPAAYRGAREVFSAFLKLGLTSFGGPIAHLAYFRAEFVERRRWLSERAYADLVALSQFLPGPASSQTGVAIGLMRGGYLGGLAAWIGFTLPSAVLLCLFAFGAGDIAGTTIGAGVLHGLKLVAVAIVAQAVLGMARQFCRSRVRVIIATLGIILTLLFPGSLGQVASIALGALAGAKGCREGAVPVAEDIAMPVSRRAGIICLGVFFLLLAFSSFPIQAGAEALFDAFYWSGAFVFGGGHVVLPLLHDAVVSPGWISNNAFLAGYGAAQAVPGPLFTIAAYLGPAANLPTGRIAGATIALVAIFLPGILALLGALPFWHALRAQPRLQAAMRGVNAAVVGVLASALYTPLWTSAVLRTTDFAIAVTGFLLLVVWRTPPLVVVVLSAAAGAGLVMIR